MPQPASRPTVLIVDDEPMIVSLLRRCLDSRYELLTASDGKVALELLTRNPVDLLIADVRMPRMTGEELARHALEQGFARRVMFVTAYDDHPDTIRALGPVITKPFDPDELCRLAEELIAPSDSLAQVRAYPTNSAERPPGEHH